MTLLFQFKTFLCQSLAIALLLATSATAKANPLNQSDLMSLWEVLWHQAGYPEALAYWKSDQPVSYLLTGGNGSSHQRHVEKTFQQLTDITGLRFQPSTDTSSTASVNLIIEITKNDHQNLDMPCFVRFLETEQRYLKKVLLVMRDELVWNCMLHEMMHAMGLSGHPSGNTVLSYFPRRQDVLSDLDRVMLRATYSGKMATFATPFEALPVLVNELVKSKDLNERDLDLAEQQANLFMNQIVNQMELFASGKGEIPSIIRRSGRASEEQIQAARVQIAYYLGTAYGDGDIVKKNLSTAFRWYELAAENGHMHAMAIIGRALLKGDDIQSQRAGWKWLNKAVDLGSQYAKETLANAEKEIPASKLALIRALQ